MLYIFVEFATCKANGASPESAEAQALVAKLQNHITDLLYRFTNAALQDTCQRVGGDPARKLSPEDRLIGSSKLAMEMGITPAYIAVGAAAGIHRYIKENELTQSPAAARQVLEEVSQLPPEGELAALILDMYQRIVDGASIQELCVAADKAKAASLGAVI